MTTSHRRGILRGDLISIIERIREIDPIVTVHPRYDASETSENDNQLCVAIITDQPLLVGYAIAANYGTNVVASGWNSPWNSPVAAFGERMAKVAEVRSLGDAGFVVYFPGYYMED